MTDDARAGSVPTRDADATRMFDERPTERFPAAGLRDSLRSGLASYRLRIVGWFVVLLALATLATMLVVGFLLFQRIDDGIRQQLVQEAD